MREARESLKQACAALAIYGGSSTGLGRFGTDFGDEVQGAFWLWVLREVARECPERQAAAQRLAAWLLGRRDGKGGFQQTSAVAETSEALRRELADAYITWALVQSGQKQLEAECQRIVQLAEQSPDAYMLALASQVLADTGKTAEAKRLCDRLAKAQAEDGRLKARAGPRFVGERGLEVESTALAVLAWLRQDGYGEQVRRAVGWMLKQREATGGFGPPHCSATAIRALLGYTQAESQPIKQGKLRIACNGELVSERPIVVNHTEPILLEGIQRKLRPGENRLAFTLSGADRLPYLLVIRWHSRKPADAGRCPLRLATELLPERVKLGQTARLIAEVANTSDQPQAMAVAALPLPAGLHVEPTELERLRRCGSVDECRLHAREVICYWRRLAPKQKVALQLDLVGAIPGKYTGQPSRAYCADCPEAAHWTDPLALEVVRD